MADKTTHYGLTKPLPEEFYDINVHNENMDIIDDELKKRASIPVTSEPPDDSNMWIDPDETDVESSHINDTNNPHCVTSAQIGAAPDGFGLGETAQIIDNLDNAIKNGFYKSNLGTPSTEIGGSAYWACLVIAYNTNYILQIAYRASYNPASIAVRRKNGDSGWGHWEYLNPPMEAGVEYRTTERHGGKAVYRKHIMYENTEDIGGGGEVFVYIPHGINNFGTCIRAEGRMNGNILPTFRSGKPVYVIGANADNIVLAMYDLVLPGGQYTFEFDIAYTKNE